MTKYDNLNELLAMWAGFKFEVKPLPRGLSYKRWFMPDGTPRSPVPDFVNSLDACKDWLLPKLTTRCIDPRIEYDHDFDQWQITLHNWTTECSKDSPTEECKEANEIPLALCLAVAKLIDWEQVK